MFAVLVALLISVFSPVVGDTGARRETIEESLPHGGLMACLRCPAYCLIP